MKTLRAKAKIIQALREKRKMSQDELAELSGESRRSVQRCEAGEVVKLKTLEAIAGALDVSVEDVGASPPQDLFDLKQCQTDFLTSNKVHRDTHLIRTVAIDLAFGYENITTALNLAPCRRMDFEILVLDKPGMLPGNAPREVITWAKAASDNVRLLADCLAEYELDAKSTLTLCVRRYKVIPETHGVAITTDGKTRYYLTECYEDGDKVPVYYFGEGGYVMFDAEAATPAQAVLVKNFEKQFQMHWDAAVPPVLEYTNGHITNRLDSPQ